jgi:hypothetical protein
MRLEWVIKHGGTATKSFFNDLEIGAKEGGEYSCPSLIVLPPSPTWVGPESIGVTITEYSSHGMQYTEER